MCTYIYCSIASIALLYAGHYKVHFWLWNWVDSSNNVGRSCIHSASTRGGRKLLSPRKQTGKFLSFSNWNSVSPARFVAANWETIPASGMNPKADSSFDSTIFLSVQVPDRHFRALLAKPSQTTVDSYRRSPGPKRESLSLLLFLPLFLSQLLRGFELWHLHENYGMEQRELACSVSIHCCCCYSSCSLPIYKQRERELR